MPGSGTLESLNIEINANSQKASEGIGRLVGSLRSLSKAVGTALAPMRALNAEIKTLTKAGAIKIPQVGQISAGETAKATKEIKAQTAAIQERTAQFKASPGVMSEFKNAVKKDEFASWMYGPNPKPTISSFNDSQGTYRPPNRPGFFSFEDYNGKDWRQENAEDTEYFSKQIGEIISQQGALENMRKTTENMYEALQAGKGASSALQQSTPLKSVTESAREATEAVKPVQDALGSGLANSANTATNALKKTDRELKQKKTDGKAAKEGLDNAASGAANVGEEAQKASGHVGVLGRLFQRVGRMLPTMLIRSALRGMMKAFGEAWTAAYEFSKHMGGDFAKSINSINGAFYSVAFSIIRTFAPVLQAIVPIVTVVANAIEYLCSGIQWLLSLLGLTSDLLGATDRQMSRFGGSGSGGSSGKNKKKGLLADWDELNVIQSDSGSGSSGGGGSGGPKISDMVKAEISEITSVLVGFGLMALGLIMCATNHLPVGIGLIAVGAAAVIQTFAVKWGGLSEQVKAEVAKITAIASTAFLAIGLILAFTNHVGLGIGAIAIGVAGLVGTVSVAWGTEVSAGVRKAVLKVLAIGGMSLMAIGMILALSNVGVGIGLAMMAAGALMWYGGASLDWNYMTTLVATALGNVGKTVQEQFDNIKKIVSDAWTTVSEWWNTNIGDPLKKAWGAVSEYFATLFGDSKTEGSIAKLASDAWTAVCGWWADNALVKTISAAWDAVKTYFVELFGDEDLGGTILGEFNRAWVTISDWWGDIVTPISEAWNKVTEFFTGLVGDSETGLIGDFSALWAEISQLWGDITTNVQKAWSGIGTWFYNNVTMPIGNFFIECVNGVIDGINWLIKALNSINITIPAVSLPLVGQLWGETKVGISGIALLEKLDSLQALPGYAEGGYGIPNGDLFIANEAGAELIGNMNGRTTVANQDQIIDGIRLGVRDANAEQNALLTRQNELLLAILQKSGVNIEPSFSWGKHNQRSSEMWNKATGG